MTPRRRPLHAALAVALTLALGSTSCFDELPSPDTASESSSESGAGTATDSTSVDGMSSTSADGSGGTPESDGDDGSGGSEGSSSAGTEPVWEGLFACSDPEGCDTWERPSCDGACPPLDAAGTCLFKQLENRGGGVRLIYKDCDGDCALTTLVPRGSGDDPVDRQSAMIDNADAPLSFGEIQRCTLSAPSFFAGCIAEFTAECANPANWVSDCQTTDKPLC